MVGITGLWGGGGGGMGMGGGDGGGGDGGGGDGVVVVVVVGGGGGEGIASRNGGQECRVCVHPNSKYVCTDKHGNVCMFIVHFGHTCRLARRGRNRQLNCERQQAEGP